MEKVPSPTTQRLVGGAARRVSENERDERERTETGNQVGSFMLKSRSFELIRSRMSHHYFKGRSPPTAGTLSHWPGIKKKKAK